VASDDSFRRAVAEAIAPYRHLLEQLVSGAIDPHDFEQEYYSIYLHDDRDWPDEVFGVVDGFFADVDAYEGDPDLRREVYRGIGPDDLKQRAAQLLEHAGVTV
jgi:hypothetical protein